MYKTIFKIQILYPFDPSEYIPHWPKMNQILKKLFNIFVYELSIQLFPIFLFTLKTFE